MKAFTLIEFVLVIAILGVTSVLLGPAVTSIVRGYDTVASRRFTLSESRAGMDRMVREIRLIPGSAQISTIASTNFQFQYPIGTSIAYSMNGSNLLRNSDVLISNVSALAFTYYDEGANITANMNNVRSVEIQFTVNSSGSNGSYTLRTRVFLRNTGNNYANFTSP